jgi:transmembrane sensor
MNDNPETPINLDAAIEDDAIAWFVRLRGEVSFEMQAAFDAWYAASGEHRRAYAWAEAHFANAASATLPDASVRASMRWSNAWLISGSAIAAMVIAMMGIPILRPFQRSSPATAHVPAPQALITAAREIRTWRLSDGSQVTLDANSRVEIAMTGAERRLRLRQGKARFSVARERRPFIVEAAAGVVRAQEAVFDVGFDRPGQVTACLISGHAEMQRLAQPAAYTAPVRLPLNATPITYPATEFVPSENRSAIADTRDWPNGWVQYRAITLRDLVSEANRYAPQPIIVDDPATGAALATGRFRLTDTDSFVSHIAETFDLTVRREPDGIHLR